MTPPPEVADAQDVQRWWRDIQRWLILLCIGLAIGFAYLTLAMAIRASIGDDALRVRTVTAGEPAKLPRITPLIGVRP